MKKNLLIVLPVFLLILSAVSCSKSNTNPAPFYAASGRWTGSSNNGIGGPVSYFAIVLKTANIIRVEANSATAPDIADGTWSIVGDSIKANYTYVGSSANYSLSAKYSSSSNVMNGTIGVGASTTGAAVFTVIKDN